MEFLPEGDWGPDAPMEPDEGPHEVLWGCVLGPIPEDHKCLGVIGIGRVWPEEHGEGPNLIVRYSAYIAPWELVGMLEEALKRAQDTRDFDAYCDDNDEDYL